jgi:flavin reductase (DIM6/NTAB) family NADH-FMN oxidoreductase RutF
MVCLTLNTAVVDEESFRIALRQWVSGVTVVTSAFQAVQHGMTVSSFISVSLAPPLLLVSLQKGTRTLELIKQSESFAVNILRQDQAALSDRFAGRHGHVENRFEGVETFTLKTQSPLLNDALVGFDCLVYSLQEIGDHVLVIGKVVALRASELQAPLVYYQRGYHGLTTLTAETEG